MIKYLIYTPPLNIMSANVPECLTFSMSPNLALFATTGEGLLTSSLLVDNPIELDFPHPISANQVQLMLTKSNDVRICPSTHSSSTSSSTDRKNDEAAYRAFVMEVMSSQR